jgi:hypothetical protein
MGERIQLLPGKLTLYRIQDAQGRGPWRPGFSMQWIDPDKDDSLCPPMMLDFPEWRRLVSRAQQRGLMHFGMAVRGIAGIHRWFTPDEISRLRGFGYRLVTADHADVIAETTSQVMIAWQLPLALLPVCEWELVA